MPCFGEGPAASARHAFGQQTEWLDQQGGHLSALQSVKCCLPFRSDLIQTGEVFFGTMFCLIVLFWAGGVESKDASHKSAILKQKL